MQPLRAGQLDTDQRPAGIRSGFACVVCGLSPLRRGFISPLGGGGEHLSANEALPIAQVQNLGKELGDEGDLLPAGELNPATANDTLTVGEQHCLEQHTRWPGCCAGQVILVARVTSARGLVKSRSASSTRSLRLCCTMAMATEIEAKASSSSASVRSPRSR